MFETHHQQSEICDGLVAGDVVSFGTTSRECREMMMRTLCGRFDARERRRRRFGEPLDPDLREQLGVETLGDVCLGPVPAIVKVAGAVAAESAPTTTLRRRVFWSDVLREVLGCKTNLGEMKACAGAVTVLVELCMTISEKKKLPKGLKACTRRFITEAVLWRSDGSVKVPTTETLRVCATTIPEWYYGEADPGLFNDTSNVLGEEVEAAVGDVARAIQNLDIDARTAKMAAKCGQRFVELGDWAGAAAFYRGAAALRPRDAVIKTNLALCALKRNSFYAAAEYAKAALSWDQKNVKARHHHARAALAIGHTTGDPTSYGKKLLQTKGKALTDLRDQWRARPPTWGTRDDALRAWRTGESEEDVAALGLWIDRLAESNKDDPELVAVKDRALRVAVLGGFRSLDDPVLALRSRCVIQRTPRGAHSASSMVYFERTKNDEVQSSHRAECYSNACFFTFLDWVCYDLSTYTSQSMFSGTFYDMCVLASCKEPSRCRPPRDQFWASLMWKTVDQQFAFMLLDLFRTPPPSRLDLLGHRTDYELSAEYIAQASDPHTTRAKVWGHIDDDDDFDDDWDHGDIFIDPAARDRAHANAQATAALMGSRGAAGGGGGPNPFDMDRIFDDPPDDMQEDQYIATLLRGGDPVHLTHPRGLHT